MLKLVESIALISGFLILQSFCRFVKFHLRLLCISTMQMTYAALVYILRPQFGFSPHLKGFIPFGLIFTFTLLVGRFLGAKATRIEFRPTASNLVMIGLLIPISEELLFRGTLLSLLPSALINATIFSAVHFLNVISRFESFSLYNLIYRFAAGYIFADSTLSTGSLFSAVVCHILNNMLGILLPWFEHESKKRRQNSCGEKHEQ